MIPDHTCPVIFITGPTASGKSAYALEMAQTHTGEIINADALQLYQGLPILTASPNVIQHQKVPHHLYGCWGPEERHMNASLWSQKALEIVSHTVAQGKFSFIVGGSGFYIYAATRGLSPIPEITLDQRNAFACHHLATPTHHLSTLLHRADPVTAARIDPSNRQRLLRALCVSTYTDKPLSAWHQISPTPWPYAYRHIVVMPPRALLKQRIHQRLQTMLAYGVVDEVRHFLQKHPNNHDLPLARALGFSDLKAYIQGKIDLDEVLRQLQLKTLHYAKRQETWLKKFVLKDSAPLTVITSPG